MFIDVYLFFKKAYLYPCMCLAACMFVYMYARYTQRPDEGSRYPVTGVTSCCGCAIWMLNVRSGSPPKAASALNH